MKEIKINVKRSTNKRNINNNNGIIGSTIIRCPYCNREFIIKSDITYHKQRYYCKECKKDFCEKDNRVKRLPE